MTIDLNNIKYKVVELTGDLKCTQKYLSDNEAYDQTHKDILEKYILRNLVNELLVEYEGGIESDCTYLLKYEKSKAKDVDGLSKYRLSVIPVKIVSDFDK